MEWVVLFAVCSLFVFAGFVLGRDTSGEYKRLNLEYLRGRKDGDVIERRMLLEELDAGGGLLKRAERAEFLARHLRNQALKNHERAELLESELLARSERLSEIDKVCRRTIHFLRGHAVFVRATGHKCTAELVVDRADELEAAINAACAPIETTPAPADNSQSEELWQPRPNDECGAGGESRQDKPENS